MPYDHVASSAHDADGAYVGVGWYGVGVGCGVGNGARGAGPGVGPGVASGAGRRVGSRVGVGALQVPQVAGQASRAFLKPSVFLDLQRLSFRATYAQSFGEHEP